MTAGKNAGSCEEVRKNFAMKMDDWEKLFFVDSEQLPVCRVASDNRCNIGRTCKYLKTSDFGFCDSQNAYYCGYKLHRSVGLVELFTYTIRPSQTWLISIT